MNYSHYCYFNFQLKRYELLLGDSWVRTLGPSDSICDDFLEEEEEFELPKGEIEQQ